MKAALLGSAALAAIAAEVWWYIPHAAAGGFLVLVAAGWYAAPRDWGVLRRVGLSLLAVELGVVAGQAMFAVRAKGATAAAVDATLGRLNGLSGTLLLIGAAAVFAFFLGMMTERGSPLSGDGYGDTSEREAARLVAQAVRRAR